MLVDFSARRTRVDTIAYGTRHETSKKRDCTLYASVWEKKNESKQKERPQRNNNNNKAEKPKIM